MVMFSKKSDFSRSEFACHCGCGSDTMDYETVAVLEDLRTWAGAPVRVNSGFRCPDWNTYVGGAKGSWHMKGRACDVYIATKTPEEVYTYLDLTYPNTYGIIRYDTFTHIDTRPQKWRG